VKRSEAGRRSRFFGFLRLRLLPGELLGLVAA
jgi:hypothetical protein